MDKQKIDIVFASCENIAPYGQYISPELIRNEWKLDATWKDQACVRMAQVQWKDDHTVDYMERHLDMTQTFIIIGDNPALFVLGKPTHERQDLHEEKRKLPDLTTVKAFIVPAGCGIILKKGTWHDFPLSCGRPVTVFIINTEEVVAALSKGKNPRELNEGDVFGLFLSKHLNLILEFPDPRLFLQQNDILIPQMGKDGYGFGMKRSEILHGWGDGSGVYVIPVVNVEVFKPGSDGPGIQPHLKSNPEIANKGWRDYGNRCGLTRLLQMFKELEIPATAVINSDAAALESVKNQLLQSNWEIGAHGLNNSEGNAGMTYLEEANVFKKCLDDLEAKLYVKPKTWLTPGFSVTERTASIASHSGIKVLLDFVNDDVPYLLKGENKEEILCIPYSLETNDFSLVLTRHFDSQQYAQTLEDHVRQLAKESGEKIVCFGMHTFVAGTPANVYALTEMFKRLIDVPGVKFCSAEQAYDLIKKKL